MTEGPIARDFSVDSENRVPGFIQNTISVTLEPLSSPTFAPAKTILGLSVDTFSFVFLGIGAIAPVIFLTIVFIAMRCYSRRKLNRFKQYEARMRISQEVWELERRQYFRSWQHRRGDNNMGRKTKSSDNDIDFADNASGAYYYSYDPKSFGVKKTRKALDIEGTTPSNSNPDVFFKESPGIVLINKYRGPHHVRAFSSPDEIITTPLKPGDSADLAALHHPLSPIVETQSPSPRSTGTNETEGNELKGGRKIPKSPSHFSMNSEEKRALESFDQIYDELDIDTTSNENTHSDCDINFSKKSSSTVPKSGNFGSKSCDSNGHTTDSVHQQKTTSNLPELDCNKSHDQVSCDNTSNNTSSSSFPIQGANPQVQNQTDSKNRQQHEINTQKRNDRLAQKSGSSSSTSSNKTSSDMTEVTPLRPVHLPLTSSLFSGYPVALVSTVTPEHQARCDLYKGSPLDSSLLLNTSREVSFTGQETRAPLAYSNPAYLRQDTPTEIEMTKL